MSKEIVKITILEKMFATYMQSQTSIGVQNI